MTCRKKYSSEPRKRTEFQYGKSQNQQTDSSRLASGACPSTPMTVAAASKLRRRPGYFCSASTPAPWAPRVARTNPLWPPINLYTLPGYQACLGAPFEFCSSMLCPGIEHVRVVLTALFCQPCNYRLPFRDL
ncbi:uncharacterized protein LOC124302359 [Neodiprion virginianus]|uniref:uncharacterized protein LOC124302359 n=1 Tax=Neodiprion virginianus TaxID=2961670 RepID=UPI001EE6EE1D|nr:uncharacterized protein LOC124302359 [Neodiprion virginianus]